MARIDPIERRIYMCICKSEEGIKAREIARDLRADAATVNHYLYASPFMRELCWQDDEYLWHGQIPQTRPHYGLAEFSGFYSSVGEFLGMDEQRFLALLKLGCENIGRNLNDTRGLFHSFADARETMIGLFRDLKEFGYPEKLSNDWEIVFELRIKKAKRIRIYADVLLVTRRHVFSLEFKMKDKIEQEEVDQCAKYCEYLDVIFGDDYEIVPVLVLTKACDLYEDATVSGTDASVQVCSGDMLYNVLDFYLGFIR
jgi:hypothetical protein